ncbi:decarboxylase [Pelosinus fermentans]|uniref:Diaminopimelate decarboxylase n=1 Tax=Pelosinus fermentans JBW45 TaxID=1192197 RepID=I9DGK5_9FIRM|nr:decarboxylase [Pelosinus fermentans]AJQ26602.1 Diaminopimelate decarboxylase [Pelosinus fermentans JBW45]
MKLSIIEEAIRRYGTPLYLFNGEDIISKFNILKGSLPDSFEILYSMKANPLLGICQLIKKAGSKAEVASIGEMHVALTAGYKSNDIVFTSPGKTTEEIEYAIDRNIYCINVESMQEAVLINEIANTKSRKVDIAIRINPHFNCIETDIKMGGVATQFGIDQSQVGLVFQALEKLVNLNIIGIHVYVGTQILNAGDIVKNTNEIIKLAIELSDKYEFSLKFIDLGGGFGIPYFAEESNLDMNILKHGMDELWSRYKSRLTDTRIAVESGRFLTADSGTYITKILYSKECKGKKYLVCDGGYSQHPAASFLGRYNKNRFPIRTLHENSIKENVTVVGPSCTPIDILGKDITIAKAQPGEYLLVDKSGAYGLTNSPTSFLSHSSAAEVFCYRDSLHLLRRRSTLNDLLSKQYGLDIIRMEDDLYK